MARRKEITRDQILDAADAVILESGGRLFTLDAVARQAGISKGGLVYSFATKDELVAAALERELTRFQNAALARAGVAQSDAEIILLAHIEEALEEDGSLARMASFLMVMLVHAPEMSMPAQTFYRHLFELFDSKTERGRAIRQAVLAVEGLFLLRGLGLVAVKEDEWMSVLHTAAESIRSIKLS